MNDSTIPLAAAVVFVTSAANVIAGSEERKLTPHNYAQVGEWSIFTFTDEAGQCVNSRATRRCSALEGLRISLYDAGDMIDSRGPGQDAMKGIFPVSFRFSANINSTTVEEANKFSSMAKIIPSKNGETWARIMEPKSGRGSIGELAKAGMIHIKFENKLLHYNLSQSSAAMRNLLEAHPNHQLSASQSSPAADSRASRQIQIPSSPSSAASVLGMDTPQNGSIAPLPAQSRRTAAGEFPTHKDEMAKPSQSRAQDRGSDSSPDDGNGTITS